MELPNTSPLPGSESTSKNFSPSPSPAKNGLKSKSSLECYKTASEKELLEESC